MRQDIIRVKFHLVGGQTVECLIPVTDGEAVTSESLNSFAKSMVGTDNLWLGNGKDWSIAIPAMSNVALIVASGIGDHEQI